MRSQVSNLIQDSTEGKAPITRLHRLTSRTVRSDMSVDEIFLRSISGKL